MDHGNYIRGSNLFLVCIITKNDSDYLTAFFFAVYSALKNGEISKKSQFFPLDQALSLTSVPTRVPPLAKVGPF